MNVVESFVNRQRAGAPVAPLELVTGMVPVSSAFWRAFAGGGAGYLVNEAVEWAANKYLGGGHYAAEDLAAFEVDDPFSVMSSDRLMAVRSGAFPA